MAMTINHRINYMARLGGYVKALTHSSYDSVWDARQDIWESVAMYANITSAFNYMALPIGYNSRACTKYGYVFKPKKPKN